MIDWSRPAALIWHEVGAARPRAAEALRHGGCPIANEVNMRLGWGADTGVCLTLLGSAARGQEGALPPLAQLLWEPFETSWDDWYLLRAAAREFSRVIERRVESDTDLCAGLCANALSAAREIAWRHARRLMDERADVRTAWWFPHHAEARVLIESLTAERSSGAPVAERTAGEIPTAVAEIPTAGRLIVPPPTDWGNWVDARLILSRDWSTLW